MPFDDLEYGGRFLHDKYKDVLGIYKKYKRHSKKILGSTALITLAIVVKMTFSNFDTVAQKASAITLEETAYKPFILEPLDINLADDFKVQEFGVKDSAVNKRMQQINVQAASAEIQEFLENSGNLCTHVKYFKVPYDIMVFRNMTMINPQVISQGTTKKNIQEISMSGETKWSYRATEIGINHYDEKLNYVYSTLYDDQAFCFAYYMI